jgi:hypothetical protein
LINTKNTTEENRIETTIEEDAQADDVDIQLTKSNKTVMVNMLMIMQTIIIEAEMILKE